MNPADFQLATPEGRARTWEHLRACMDRQEAAAREQQAAIIEEGAQVGDTVRLSPFLTGQVAEIRCEGLQMPQALVISEQPTGRGGETATRSEWVALKGLQVVQSPAPLPQPLPLPEAEQELPEGQEEG